MSYSDQIGLIRFKYMQGISDLGTRLGVLGPEAKFRCPRSNEMFTSKQFEKNWRPTCHLVCCIVHGVLEAYYIMDHDCKKSSDMNLTVICRTLDHAFRILEQRGVKPPAHICVQTDNTAREQRNQHTFMFFSWAVAKGLWGSASPMFYLPGHSHNECDQRFVPVAAALLRSDSLETPDDIWLWNLQFLDFL